jgi:hypothetical protein
MSVHSLKRRFLAPSVLFLFAAPLFALNPAARSESRMVYDPAIHRVVLYGGSSPVDRGTKQTYELNDTWERTQVRWIQHFPAHNPGKRGAHVMVWDSNRNRVLLFGGHNGSTALNDTWAYQNDDWTQIDTPNSPTPRYIAGGAFDPVRDRFIIFGGNQFAQDGKTATPVYDTWEFDGTTWVQTNSSGPQILKPILVYDAARNQVLMLGLDAKAVTLMYAYDAGSSSWKQLTPTTLPACANEGAMVYDDATQKVFYTGGVCTGSSSTEDNLEWDGTNWATVTVNTNAGRLFGMAMTYDSEHDEVVLFGGADVLNVMHSSTLVYANKVWLDVSGGGDDPAPRSLFSFVTDPVNNAIWMFGGVDDSQTFQDFWKFQNGHWEEIGNGDEPTDCVYPLASYDTDRQKMVLVCENSTTWEFDVTNSTWKQATNLKEVPPIRRFGQMAYDQSLKKTVLFGGYDTNYLNQTWTWDGTAWTQVAKKNPPPSRALASMWYDPALKKTVMYGGIGRLSSTDRIIRYSDMWTFDGSNWTQLNPIKDTPGASSGTPGPRYGAQTSIDPRTNKLLLFGGLRVDTDSTGVQTQVYSDDTWQWDGTNWTKLDPAVAPPARENAGLTFDPIRNEMVMFAGFSGTYHTDTWGYTDGVWHPRVENTGRRRSAAR